MTQLVDAIVTVLSGKYAGSRGVVMYRAEPHPLSTAQPRWAVRAYVEAAHAVYVTLLVQERNLEVHDDDRNL